MQIYYCSNQQDDLLWFDPEESHHIIRVMRYKKGQAIHVTDGRGSLYEAALITDDPRKCNARILKCIQREEKTSNGLHVAVSPVKNPSRFEWFVEKATEIGINRITPMLCNHTEKSRLNADRLRKIAISAMKQSQRLWLPEIEPLRSFDEVVKETPAGEGYIAWVDESHNQILFKDAYKPGTNATVLIGPEGDFTEKEIRAALNSGFMPISLGKYRLRTETAALLVCCIYHFINQQML